MSEDPADSKTARARRFAKALLWKVKLRGAEDQQVVADWDDFSNDPDFQNVIGDFSKGFAERLATSTLDAKCDSGNDSEFKQLGLAYRRVSGHDRWSVSNLARACEDDVGKWLDCELSRGKSPVVPRLVGIIHDWVNGGESRVVVLEDVFAECLKLLLKDHPSLGENGNDLPVTVSANAEGEVPGRAPPVDDTVAGGKATWKATAPLPKTVKVSPTAVPRIAPNVRQREDSAVAGAAGVHSGGSGGVTVPEAQKSRQTVAQVKPEEARKAAEPVPPVLWQYKPVPEGPDKHAEYDSRQGVSPEGYPIIGARVRGKKHKHEGTNCDDWYEFKTSGRWTVLAVSDGGGAYKFSRVGAKLSCQTVVNTLVDALEKPEVAELKAAAKGATPEDLEKLVGHYRETVGAAIKLAMRAALQAVLKRIGELNAGFEYLKEVNNSPTLKPLTLRDFYATLLVAVHAALEIDGKSYSFVMGCACGDGMIGVISNNADPENACTLLMKADSGPNSGETEFLCERLLVEEELQGRMYPGLFGGWKAILLSTDGVADIFFPNNPGITRVYGDLVLNRIVALPRPGVDEELLSALATTGVKTLEEFKRLKINVPVYRILESGPKPVEVASLAAFAQQLGLENEKVALNQVLLAGACQHLSDPAPEATKPEDRLVHWLDAYTVRGEFDDRTLLVMFPENPK